ncbi:MAG: NAD(P)-dependent oxidoreductase [Meiothermus sp.]|nr:NAD(P)-dependent oxidoreductase [Meiothermus sp.]
MPRVGVVGVGTMGMLAVQLLLEKGQAVVVSDVNPAALERVRLLGAQPVDALAQVAEQAEIILLFVPGPAQVEAVVAGDGGLLSAGRTGQTIVDLSTIDPQTTRRLGRQAADLGVDYLDAPILGRPAAVGRWVLPVGGEAEVLERCRPVLEKLAREVIHVGPLGAGHTLKLLNALMFSAINAMTAEMMAISHKAGLEPKVLYETITASEAATVSGLFRECGRKIVERDFDPAFTIDLLCKDNGLAIQMAKEVGAPPLLAGAIQTINELAKATGHGREDTSALVKVYEQLLEVR